MVAQTAHEAEKFNAQSMSQHPCRRIDCNSLCSKESMGTITTGYDPESGRSLLLHAVATPGDLSSDFKAPSKYFVAMLICNAPGFTNNDLAILSRKLIDAGCAYLSCWGQDCERVHDLFDTEWIDNGFDPGSSGTIMTTWHTDDSLDDFIEYAIWFTEPTDEYQKECRSLVAIVIDDVHASNRIREVFNDPALFYSARELDT